MDIEEKKQQQQQEEEEFKQDDQLSFFLQCKVCRDQYDEQLKKPLILQCGHTFCSFCIEKLTEDGIVICPLDKKACEISDQLIINYAIIEALDEQQSKEDALYCKKHQKEIIKFFCVDEKVSICQECLLESHIGHQIKPAQEYVDMKKVKQNAQKFLSQLEINSNKILEMKSQVEEEYTDNYDQIEICKEKMIEEFHKAYHNSAETLKKTMEELQNNFVKKQQKIKELIKESTEILAKIEQSTNETEQIKEVFLMKEVIVFQGKKLRELIKQNQELSENFVIPEENFTLPTILSQDFVLNFRKIQNPHYDQQYFKLLNTLKDQEVIKSEKIFKAMSRVNRKNFVKPNEMIRCYNDSALPIGWKTTISAPHMHAHTLEALKNHLRKGAKVLDIGFGSGFICAVFAELIGPKGKVYGVDHIQAIKDFAQENISKDNKYLLDSQQVELIVKDGRKGLPEHGPVIHVGGAIESIPIEMKNQLACGGRLFAPVGLAGGFQTIIVLDKDKNGKITEKSLLKVIYGMLGNVEDQI